MVWQGQTRFHRLDICIYTTSHCYHACTPHCCRQPIVVESPFNKPILYCSDHILLLFVTSSYSRSHVCVPVLCIPSPFLPINSLSPCLQSIRACQHIESCLEAINGSPKAKNCSLNYKSEILQCHQKAKNRMLSFRRFRRQGKHTCALRKLILGIRAPDSKEGSETNPFQVC